MGVARTGSSAPAAPEKRLKSKSRRTAIADFCRVIGFLKSSEFLHTGIRTHVLIFYFYIYRIVKSGCLSVPVVIQSVQSFSAKAENEPDALIAARLEYCTTSTLSF